MEWQAHLPLEGSRGVSFVLFVNLDNFNLKLLYHVN